MVNQRQSGITELHLARHHLHEINFLRRRYERREKEEQAEVPLAGVMVISAATRCGRQNLLYIDEM